VTRLPISVTGWSRTVALARASVAILFTVTFILLAFTDDDWINNDGGVSSVNDEDKSVQLVTGLLFATACGWGAWRLARPALVRRAYLELTPESLVVVHPGLLKRPLQIHRSYVKATAVDPRPWRWRWLGNKGRFHLGGAGADPTIGPITGGSLPISEPVTPVTGAEMTPSGAKPEHGLPEWLFSVNGGSPLPLLSTVDDVPNVAFLFEEPIRMVSVRRGMRPFATKSPVHVLAHGRAARGLLVKVKDAAAAEQALSQWTTVRPLTTADVLTIQPDEEYARRARRSRRAVNVWLGILLLFLVGGPVLSELAEAANSSL
jgi:hypothetical protein